MESFAEAKIKEIYLKRIFKSVLNCYKTCGYRLTKTSEISYIICFSKIIGKI